MFLTKYLTQISDKITVLSSTRLLGRLGGQTRFARGVDNHRLSSPLPWILGPETPAKAAGAGPGHPLHSKESAQVPRGPSVAVVESLHQSHSSAQRPPDGGGVDGGQRGNRGAQAEIRQGRQRESGTAGEKRPLGDEVDGNHHGFAGRFGETTF